MTCSSEDCEKPVRTRGWCQVHYHRWLRHGSPTHLAKKCAPHGASLQERFEVKIERTPDGCWNWVGARTPQGYGSFRIPEKDAMDLAHRVSYEWHRGPIPEGLHVDHLCRNRLCVNPDHLEPVTPAENSRRGAKGRLVTHCVHGHLYTERNTGRRKSGRRYCLDCWGSRARARNAQDTARPTDAVARIVSDLHERMTPPRPKPEAGEPERVARAAQKEATA